MSELSIQQNKQIDNYIATHKGVSRKQAQEILFNRNGNKSNSNQGLKVEPNNSTNNKKTKKTYNANSSQAKQQGYDLAKALYNQIEGPSLNSKTINLLKKITPENVIHVLDYYSKQTKGKETLAQAICNEWGLDEITVKQYICNSLTTLAKSKGVTGIYFGDYMKTNNIETLNKWIENAKTKIKIALNINAEETNVIKKNPSSYHNNYTNTNTNVNPAQIYKNRQGMQLGQDLYNQIQGLSDKNKTLQLLSKINSDNILFAMNKYKSLSKENLAQAISKEYGLDITSSKHIREQEIEVLYYKLKTFAAKNRIKIPENLRLNPNEKDLETLVSKTERLQMYINFKIPKQEISLKKYINNFGSAGDYETRKNFEDETGINIDEAILTDPTISKSDKINAIRNNYTYLAKLANEDNIDIKDIIKDANLDLNNLVNDNNFKKYYPLFKTTTERLEARVFCSQTNNSQINGKIDKNFEQGYVGDCWLLSVIKGLSMKPKGLKLLNDSITVLPNGNVKVNLRGINKTYEISKKEIANSKELSTGDGDVRAIEIAVNRYLRESYKYGKGVDASVDSNYEYVAYHILTGNKGLKIDREMNKAFNSEVIKHRQITNDDINQFNNNNIIITVSSVLDPSKPELKIKNNKTKENSIITTGHSYVVSRADKEYVYLINPWDTSTEIPLNRKTFMEYFDTIEKLEL